MSWDRAVRADAWDSVHQMRVVTRKIRSLLRASEESFGIADDSPILEDLKQLAAVLGVARDAEVLAEKYENALDGLPAELIRGPVRERLVEGGKRRYRSRLEAFAGGDEIGALLPVARRIGRADRCGAATLGAVAPNPNR